MNTRDTSLLPDALPASRSGWRLPAWPAGRGLIATPTATVLVLLALAEFLSRSGLINARKFPPVSVVLEALAREVTSGRLWAPLGQTLATWGLALALSLLAALVIGLSLGMNRIVRAATAPIIEFIRPVPSTALIPLVILTLGTSLNAALFLTCFGTVWQILPSIFRGLSQVEPVSRDTARAFGFTRLQQLRWLVVPGMLPYLWTALRLGAAASLVLLISMELLAGINGVGHQIAMAYAGANAPTMYAYILVASLIGGGVNIWLTRFIDKRITPPVGGKR